MLVEQALDAIKRVSGATAANSFSLLADDGEEKVWAAMNQHALDSEDRRFLVVRNAEKIKAWDQFESWMTSRQAPNVRVVMVAGERTWPVQRNAEARARVVKSTQAMYVECSLPKSNPDRSAVEAIQTWSRLTTEQATYLARRTGYNLARCRDVCVWLSLLSVEVTTQVIDLLTEASPSQSFVTALAKLDKVGAVSAAQRLSQSERAAVVTHLADTLSDLDRLHRALRKAVLRSSDLQLVRAETARQADMRLDRVIELWESAKHYDPQTVQRRAELLVLADENRSEVGVLERLVVQW